MSTNEAMKKASAERFPMDGTTPALIFAFREAFEAGWAAASSQEPDWEYGAGYEADNGLEMRWFSMGGAAYTVREAAENEVARFDDPQVRLVRRAKPGPWAPVEGVVR